MDREILSRPIEIYGRILPNRIGIQPLECFDTDKDGSSAALKPWKNDYALENLF